MAKFASISNGMYTNQYDSEVKITAFMANSTDKQVKMFNTVFPVPSGQFQISLDPILGKTKQINDIFNKRGFLAGSTSGEVQLTEKTTSISLKTDYVFLNSDKKGIEMSGNILDAMIKGEGFMHNSAYHKIVGTNGTYKKGFNTNTNMFFGKLLELDGRLIIPDAATDGGNAITIGGGELYSFSLSEAIPELKVRRDLDKLEPIKEKAEFAREYGLKKYIHLSTRKKFETDK